MPRPKVKKEAFYAVGVGHVPGIYQTWEEVLQQIRGCSGAKHQKFDTLEDAEIYVKSFQVSTLDMIYHMKAFTDGAMNNNGRGIGSLIIFKNEWFFRSVNMTDSYLTEDLHFHNIEADDLWAVHLEAIAVIDLLRSLRTEPTSILIVTDNNAVYSAMKTMRLPSKKSELFRYLCDRIFYELDRLRNNGWEFGFDWVSSHQNITDKDPASVDVRLRGNEYADKAAKGNPEWIFAFLPPSETCFRRDISDVGKNH